MQAMGARASRATAASRGARQQNASVSLRGRRAGPESSFLRAQGSRFARGDGRVAAPQRLVASTAKSARPGRGRAPLRIAAVRVAGVEVPNAKRVETALTYIYGIGPTLAKTILKKTDIENKHTRDLTEDELARLRAEVEGGEYLIEGDLRRFNAMNIKRLIDIGCYRGRRHIMGLPVRGQKTKTNARTRKGKKRTVASKKK